MNKIETSNAAVASAPEQAAAQKRKMLRVLVVDDNLADQRLTIDQLGEIWPFEKEMAVATAATGEEAIETVRTTQLSLMVLDWNLPQMSGADVLRQMRQLGSRVPVLILTGQDREQLECDLEQLGAAYLNKNVLDSRTFENAIARSLMFQEHAA